MGLYDNLYYIKDSTLSALTEAVNLKVGGTKSEMSIPEITEMISYYQGDNSDLIARTKSEITFNGVSMASYALQGYLNLKTFNAPNLKEVPAYCFSEFYEWSYPSWSTKTVFENGDYVIDFIKPNMQLNKVSLPMCSLISYGAFQYCYDLSEVELPAVTAVSFGQLSGLYAMYPSAYKQIRYTKSTSTTEMDVYGLKLTLPNCMAIGSAAFSYYCTRLTDIVLPVCTVIGSSAFYGNWDNSAITLKTISAPKVACIYDKAFYQCHELESVYLPKCTVIYSYAFEYCSKLKELNLPKVFVIGEYNFYSCSQLKKVSMPALTAFMGGSALNYAFQYLENLEEAYLPAATATYWTFQNCYKLSSVNLDSCTFLNGTFYACSNLKNINLPNCTTLSYGVFLYCSNLEKVAIPKCSSIHPDAFAGCEKLTQIVWNEITSMPIIMGSYFATTLPISCKVIVPSSLYNTFLESSAWSNIHNNLTSSIS